MEREDIGWLEWVLDAGCSVMLLALVTGIAALVALAVKKVVWG